MFIRRNECIKGPTALTADGDVERVLLGPDFDAANGSNKITTASVYVEQDTDIVIPSGDAVNLFKARSHLAGRIKLRIGGDIAVEYLITAINPTTGLATIDRPYEGETNPSASYTVTGINSAKKIRVFGFTSAIQIAVINLDGSIGKYEEISGDFAEFVHEAQCLGFRYRKATPGTEAFKAELYGEAK